MSVVDPPRQEPAFTTEAGRLAEYGNRLMNQLHSNIRVQTVSITPASVAANTDAEEGFTVSRALVGDFVSVSPPSITAGVLPVCARVSANGTVQIAFRNVTGGALTPAAGDYVFAMMRTP